MDRQEQLHELRARILQTEEDRLHGARTMSIAGTREAMKEVPAPINADDMTVDELRVELLAGYNDILTPRMSLQRFSAAPEWANAAGRPFHTCRTEGSPRPCRAHCR